MGQRPTEAEVAQRRGDEQTEGARTEHRHDVALGDRRAEHGVHRAGHGLDGDGVRVAQAVGHRVELAGVRHETGARPAATRVRAEAGLQAGPDVAEGQTAAVADVAGLAGGARRLDPPGRAPEHRLQDDPAARGQRRAVGPDRVLRPPCRPPRGRARRESETMSSK